MKIFINEMPEEGVDREENLSAQDLDIETGQIHYVNGINVTAHIERDKDLLHITCSIEGVRKNVCSRCVEGFESQFSKKLDFVYELKSEYAIVLDGYIREEIILDYPVKMLCQPGCKGLCPRCGKNLNQGLCGCQL